MSRSLLLGLWLAWCVLATGCGGAAALQETYAPLYRASRALDGAVSVGVTHADFGHLLQSLSTEVLIAGDRATNDSEKSVVAAYSDVLAVYKDSSTLWKAQIESAGDSWRAGRILASGEAGEIGEKYHLALVDGAFLPEDTIQRVWSVAAKKSSDANNLYFSNGKKPAS